MAFSFRGLIEASDYNGFAALINEVYADTNTGATGEATGGFGYGQTAIPSVTATSGSTPGSVITAAQWNLLLGRLHDCADHQGTAIPLTVPTSVTQTVDQVSHFPDLVAAINSIRTNRFNIASGIGAVASASTTSQGGSWDATRTQTVTATFANWNQMRYFFNAGGKIRFSFSFTGTPNNTTETNWIALSSSIATVSYGYTSTTSSGGTGTSAGGFYDTTTSNLLKYSRVPTSYTTEEYRIEARLNAAPGSATQIIFTISYITPTGGDIIDLTLNSERAIFNPNDVANNIAITIPTLTASPIS